MASKACRRWPSARSTDARSDLVVGRDVQVVKLAGVVVTDEARHLLEIVGLEVDRGFRDARHVLLPACDERLYVEAARRLHAVEPQVSGARIEIGFA